MSNARDWSQFSLLLVDVQHDFWEPEMTESHPDFAENVAALLTLARHEGLDVVHLRACFQPDKSDWMSHYKLGDWIPCVAGTPGVAVFPYAEEQPNETVLVKQTFNGFQNPALHAHLRAAGKRFVLVAGLITSVCVFLTAASAAQHGYLTAIIEDCSADRSAMHQHVLDNYPFIFQRTTLAALPNSIRQWQSAIDRLEAQQ